VSSCSADDLADACVFLMERHDVNDIGEFVNIGTGDDITVSELAELVRRIVGFEGKLVFDPPNRTERPGSYWTSHE
jgi:GDP-L-fucose synthase